MVELPSTVSLTGPRVILRPFRIDDASDVALSCQDPDIPRFTFMPEAMTEAQAREWIERRLELWARGLFSFAITMPPDLRFAGQIGVHLEEPFRRAETFYWLDHRVRGQGIAAEALDVVTRWVFDEHQVVRAHLITHLDNHASQRVARQCGYQREGVLRAWEPIQNDQPDVVMWSRLASDPAPAFSRS
ncbi:GNAT family N-acetyltransferase [Ilumatobacter sp.]|uniref:GNAT family N-acetyltransferase n=1 Tax=Ilumatobacter sp. TaxID=1967498 RepID=UPI003C7015EE